MPNKAPTVATLGQSQAIMSSRLFPILTLLQGTEAMRDAGEDFLPRYDQETDRIYENRRERAVLYNYFKRTASALVGRPFREMVKVSDESANLEVLLSNIDTLGRDIHSFLHDTFFLGLTRGFVGIFTDFPSPSEEVRNLQQERDMGLRPYLRHIPAEDFVAGHAEIIGGREVVTHVRIREDFVERSGRWGETLQRRIRVFDRRAEGVFWELWREIEGKRAEDAWVLEDSGEMSISEIPLTVFYAGEREAFLQAEPPLKDLADLNIAHFQSYSDQIHVLTVSRFPILFATGVEDEKLEVGPNKFLTASAENARFGYVEHTGAAIAAGRQDLKDLEERMATMGVDLMVRRSGDRATATARTIDESRGGSVLEAMARSFSLTATRALRHAEEWMGQTPNVTVELNADFGTGMSDQIELNVLAEARRERDLSREDFLSELQRRNVLPEVFDLEKNNDRLDAEGPLIPIGDLVKPGPPGPNDINQ